jgi:hypothetical protein
MLGGLPRREPGPRGAPWVSYPVPRYNLRDINFSFIFVFPLLGRLLRRGSLMS